MRLFSLISKGSAALLKLNSFLLLLWMLHPTLIFSTPSDYVLNRPVYAFEFLNYRSGENQNYIEMFSQFSTNNLIFIRSDDGFAASYELSLTIYDQSDNEVAATSFIDSVSIQSFWDIDRYRPPQLLHLLLFLQPGEYKARLSFTDREIGIPWDLQKDITIPKYNTAELQLSDLQLATSISVSDEKDNLVKNGRKVIPNVLRVVEMDSDKLHVYSEIYNLQNTVEGPEDEFIATYAIENEKGDEVSSFKLRQKKPGDTCALSVAVPVEKLTEGEYLLILTVEDLAKAQKVSKSTKFFVVAPYSEPYL